MNVTSDLEEDLSGQVFGFGDTTAGQIAGDGSGQIAVDGCPRLIVAGPGAIESVVADLISKLNQSAPIEDARTRTLEMTLEFGSMGPSPPVAHAGRCRCKRDISFARRRNPHVSRGDYRDMREARPEGPNRLRRGRGDRGASLVEFAIIAPLLFLLIFGVFEFGRLIATHTAFNTASREGARFGTTNGDRNGDGLPNFADCAEIRAVARERAVMASLADHDIAIFFDNGEGTPVYADCQGGEPPATDTVATGDRIRVVITKDFESPVPVLSSFLNKVELEAEQSRTIFRVIVDE